MVQVVRKISSVVSQRLPVFGTEEFLSAKGSDYGWFLSEDFALPFTIDGRFTKLGFSRLIFTTEVIGLRNDLTPEAEAQFVDEVLNICKRGSAIKVDAIANQANAVFRVKPSECEFVDWASYIVDLRVPEATIFAGFHGYHKNRVRRATSGGVTVTTTEEIEAVYENLKATMVRQGLLYYPSKSYLRELQRRLQDQITFYVAEHNGNIQGSAVVLHNHLGGFYYYGGSIADPFPGSLNFMHFEIMKDLKRKNVPLYDFMGARLVVDDASKLAGVQRFKRRFASGMRQGYHFRKILSPLKYRIFVLALKTYFALKGSRYEGDAIDQINQSKSPGAAISSEEQVSVEAR